MVILVTSTATLAMALHDHHDHIAEMKNHSHNAEMEGMVKTIRELKDNRFCLSNFCFPCWDHNETG